MKNELFHSDVLDHGYIKLIYVMGSDDRIAQCARVSLGNDVTTQKSKKDNMRLIRRLYRDRHTSPFEMCELQFFIKCPIFVARQWMRHRTGSYNEVSARYSEMEDAFYLPEMSQIRKQSTLNKQGRSGEFDLEDALIVKSIIENSSKDSYESYKKLLNLGLTRELARSVIPVGFYTKFAWKTNLHNCLNFIKLRSADDAQYEIRVYSDVIRDVIINRYFPITYGAAFQEEINEAL